jgi:hypothetical protein
MASSGIARSVLGDSNAIDRRTAATSRIRPPESPGEPLAATFTSVSIREHGRWLIAHLVGDSFLPARRTN